MTDDNTNVIEKTVEQVTQSTSGIEAMVANTFASIEQQVKDAVQQGTDAALDKVKEIATGALGGALGGSALGGMLGGLFGEANKQDPKE